MKKYVLDLRFPSLIIPYTNMTFVLNLNLAISLLILPWNPINFYSDLIAFLKDLKSISQDSAFFSNNGVKPES